MPQLIDILAQNESITAAELVRAVRLQEERSIPLAEVLVWESLLREDDIFFMLQRALGMAAVPEERLLHLTLTPEVRRRVPRSFARAQVLIPLDLDVNKGVLLAALFDPSDRGVLEKLRNTARVAEIRPYLARRSSILNALKAVYSGEDEFRDGEPEWLPVGKPTPESRAQVAPESKVEIDPGLVEELLLSTGKAPEPLRSIRVQRPHVFRAAEAPPSPSPTSPPAPVEKPPAAAGSGPRRRLVPAAPPDPASARSGTIRGSAGAVPLARSARTGPTRGSAAVPSSLGSTPDVSDHGRARSMDEETTSVFQVDKYPKSAEETSELSIPDYDAEREGEGPDVGVDLTPQLEPLSTTKTMRPPEIEQREQTESLLRELLSSVGVLISMLEERIDPSGGGCREYGRVSRFVARELGLDEITVARLAVAAQLFGLDLALRRELGITARVDVAAAFAAQPSAPGGLGPSLRSLGSTVLGLEESSAQQALGVSLIGIVADYLELRAESEDNHPDPETVAQLLRTGGADAQMIDALIRALEVLDTRRVRLSPGPAGSR